MACGVWRSVRMQVRMKDVHTCCASHRAGSLRKSARHRSAPARCHRTHCWSLAGGLRCATTCPTHPPTQMGPAGGMRKSKPPTKPAHLVHKASVVASCCGGDRGSCGEWRSSQSLQPGSQKACQYSHTKPHTQPHDHTATHTPNTPNTHLHMHADAHVKRWPGDGLQQKRRLASLSLPDMAGLTIGDASAVKLADQCGAIATPSSSPLLPLHLPARYTNTTVLFGRTTACPRKRGGNNTVADGGAASSRGEADAPTIRFQTSCLSAGRSPSSRACAYKAQHARTCAHTDDEPATLRTDGLFTMQFHADWSPSWWSRITRCSHGPAGNRQHTQGRPRDTHHPQQAHE